MHVAQQFANNPSGSFPDQHELWKDLKAAYRLFDCEQVTFEAIARPHWQWTRNQAQGRCLVIGDTTEFDFGKKRQIQDIGETGNGSGQGFLLHNALMVKADSQEIIGFQSNPNQPDTDADGLLDLQEVAEYGSNITNPDTDGDGIPDGADVDVDGDGTNDNGTDTDGDGINDNSDADVDGDGTDDNGTDSDGDGITDSEDTVDDSADSDNDGLPDALDEDDNNIDTDGDGIPDIIEGHPTSGDGNLLIEVHGLKMYFPVRGGVFFQKTVLELGGSDPFAALSSSSGSGSALCR